MVPFENLILQVLSFAEGGDGDIVVEPDCHACCATAATHGGARLTPKRHAQFLFLSDNSTKPLDLWHGPGRSKFSMWVCRWVLRNHCSRSAFEQLNAVPSLDA